MKCTITLGHVASGVWVHLCSHQIQCRPHLISVPYLAYIWHILLCVEPLGNDRWRSSALPSRTYLTFLLYLCCFTFMDFRITLASTDLYIYRGEENSINAGGLLQCSVLNKDGTSSKHSPTTTSHWIPTVDPGWQSCLSLPINLDAVSLLGQLSKRWTLP